MGSCKTDKEHSDSVKGGQFLDFLTNYKLTRKNCELLRHTTTASASRTFQQRNPTVCVQKPRTIIMKPDTTGVFGLTRDVSLTTAELQAEVCTYQNVNLTSLATHR
jgi:hypothetical protein